MSWHVHGLCRKVVKGYALHTRRTMCLGKSKKKSEHILCTFYPVWFKRISAGVGPFAFAVPRWVTFELVGLLYSTPTY